jgi:hypothetical protein
MTLPQRLILRCHVHELQPYFKGQDHTLALKVKSEQILSGNISQLHMNLTDGLQLKKNAVDLGKRVGFGFL